jgi:hypothetical protein
LPFLFGLPGLWYLFEPSAQPLSAQTQRSALGEALVKMSRKEQKRGEHFVPPILLAGDLLKLLTSATN